MGNILVTGALGQIGSELVPALRQRYGREQVIATDASRRSRSGLDGSFWKNMGLLLQQGLAAGEGP